MELAATLEFLKVASCSCLAKNILGRDNIGKKMGRPTDNLRDKKIGFRMSEKEIEDIQKCAEKMSTNRVNAVVEGINLLKEKLGILEE